MAQEIRKRIVIGPGGSVSFEDEALPEGAEAEVVVRLGPGPHARRSLASFMGAGGGLFRDADEVDRYIRAERDSWGI